MTQAEINNKISALQATINSKEQELNTAKKYLQTWNKALEVAQRAVGFSDDSNRAEAEQTEKDAEKKVDEWSDKVKKLENEISQLNQELSQYKSMTSTSNTTDNKSSTTDNTSASDSSSNPDPRQTMTQQELEQNAKMAEKYPERTVNGVYYADDTALANAKAAEEKRLQGESKQAEAQAIAKAQKLAAAMKTINETLYGTDNSEVITQLQGSVGGAELSSILGNAIDIRARQHLLNFNDFKEDFKAANTGKPPHNRDPFPVDQKIEEFETHQPRVKVHEIVTHNHGKSAAIMGIMQFDATEKRLVDRPFHRNISLNL